MSMLLPWAIYDTRSVWGACASEPIACGVFAVWPKEQANSHIFFVFILMEAEIGEFEVKHLAWFG